MSTTQAEVDRLIEQFDPEASFRRLTGWSAKIVLVLCAGLAAWHYYTAGFGLHNEIAHRAIHLTVVLGLCFLVFPRQKRLPGPWEWLVSLGLVTFYLFMGTQLLAGSDAITVIDRRCGSPLDAGRVLQILLAHLRQVQVV